MTDTDQLHQDFLRDFSKLLRRYNSDFEVMEGDPVIFFHGELNEDGDPIRPYTDFVLPKYINPN